MSSEPRQLLRPPGRLSSRTSEDDQLDDLSRAHAPSPGKRTRQDASDEDAGAAALREADTILASKRVDRRAEPGGDEADDDGVAGAMKLVSAAGGGKSLPAELAARLGAELGIDASTIRIHTGDGAARAAVQLRARAFTIGDDIYFGDGAYDPQSEAGVELIAHEVAHVAQQRTGASTGTGRVSMPGDAHERDADAFAHRISTKKSIRYDAARGESFDAFVRRAGTKLEIPHLGDMGELFGTNLDAATSLKGEAAELASRAIAASAFVMHEIISVADPSPKRDEMLHELSHIMNLDNARVLERPGARAHEAARTSPASTQIHRKDDPPAGGESVEDLAEKYFKLFADAAALVKNERKDDGEDKLYFRFTGQKNKVKFDQASDDPWLLNNFVTAMADLAPKNKLDVKSDATYARYLGIITGDDKRMAKFRVSRVGGDVNRTYVFTQGGTFDPIVDDNASDARKAADPKKQFEAYFAAVKKLKAKGRLAKFSSNSPFDGKAITEKHVRFEKKEADQYRHDLEETLAKEYAKLGEKSWDTFYNEVMGGDEGEGIFDAAYNGVQGNIFEQLVQLTVTDDGDGVLNDQRPIFRDGRLKKFGRNPRTGDNSFFSGTAVKIVIDAKAAAAGIDLNQAQAYAMVVNKGIRGYFKGQDKSVGKKYKGIAYAVPSQTIADKASGQLDRLFAEDAASRALFFVSPSPKGLKQWLLKFNPEITLQSKDKGDYVSIPKPAVMVPGVSIDRADISLAPGSDDIKSGTLYMGLNLGGQFEAHGIKKDITPGAGGGVVENKFTEFKNKLDKLLGPVSVDAKLVDAGIQATVSVKPGAAKIPKFNLDKGELTATYGEQGLKVSGTVGISHQSGKISALIKASYNNGQWSFEGTGTLSPGLVDGLEETTVGVKYKDEQTTIFCSQAGYTRKFGPITLSGHVYDLEYNVQKESFSGTGSLEADLGMFGKASASATLEDNKVKSAEFTYDSPEFKYPAKSETPSFTGTVGGKIAFQDGKWSGAIKGTANVNVKGLQSVAGDKGLGLAVDAHINPDGKYGGTVKTTSPLKFGKYVEIPSLSATLKDDGSLEGDFSIEVKNIKWLKDTSISCHVDKDGIHVKAFHLEAAFGSEEKNKFWGSLTVDYTDEKGLSITGKVNYKIKEGMIASGTLTYNNADHTVSLHMEVSEIPLLDSTIAKKTLFSASKKIPVINIYGIGAYIDIGFDLAFDMGFKLGIKPEVDFVGFSLDTGEFQEIDAKLKLMGNIYAEMTGTPKLGIGIFILDPSLLAGGGGLKMPIVARGDINPTGTIAAKYTPNGGVSAGLAFDMSMTFGIHASLVPYADFDVLSGLWNPTWTGSPIAEFDILPKKELFKLHVDFGDDMTKKTDPPPTPGQNAAPAASGGENDDKFKQKDGAAVDKSDGKAPAPVKGESSPEGGDDGPFSLSSLLDKLKASVPGVATAERVFNIASKVWKVVKPIYELVKPLFDVIGKRIEAFIDLFTTRLPGEGESWLSWVWELAKKVLNVAFGGLIDFVEAVWSMLSSAGSFIKQMVNKLVTEGYIGVKRSVYYIWRPWPMDDYNFMAAAEYKLTIPGVLDVGHHGPTSFLLSPNGAVALGLYKVLQACDVPITDSSNSSIGEPYNDRWTGDGAGQHN